jgi:hypothetical protein
MPIIQLTPQLQHAVHLLKRIELREDASSFLSVPLFSKEESFAARIFNRPVNTRQKEQTEPSCNWW